MGTESVYQIVQSGRTECHAGVSQEGLTCEILTGRPYLQDTHKTQLSPSVLTLRIPVMCRAHALLHEMLSREIPAKTSSVFSSLSLHTLSFYHTTLTIKSHNKYRVQKIKYNYNQIWNGIKANKQHLCKSQLYKSHNVHLIDI